MNTENLSELVSALVKAQAEFTAIPKDSANPFFKSKYAGLPIVVETAAPILAKHGLAVSQHVAIEDGQDVLITYLLHTSGQHLAHAMRLHLVKDDPQGQGSAITYARRYAYMAVLGLVADDDDDGNAASRRQSSKVAGKPVKVTKPTGAITVEQVESIKARAAAANLSGEPLRSLVAEAVGRSVSAYQDLTIDEAGLVLAAIGAA